MKLNEKSRGLGDTIEKFTTVTGIKSAVTRVVKATGAVATVTGLDSSTILDLSADIFTNAPNDTYIVFQGGPIFEQRIDSSSGCLLYIGSSATISGAGDEYVDVCVDTVSGTVQSPNTVTFKNFKVGNYLPVQVKKLRSNGSSSSIRNQVCIAIW